MRSKNSQWKTIKRIMFLVMFISAALLAVSFTNEGNNKEKILIEKTGNGYNVYSAENELLLEFTKQNTDSASLSTLKYIYETSKELQNKVDVPDQKNPQILKSSF